MAVYVLEFHQASVTSILQKRGRKARQKKKWGTRKINKKRTKRTWEHARNNAFFPGRWRKINQLFFPNNTMARKIRLKKRNPKKKGVCYTSLMLCFILKLRELTKFIVYQVLQATFSSPDLLLVRVYRGHKCLQTF